MEKYGNYYGLDLHQRINLFKFEIDKGTKLYVAEDIEDINNSIKNNSLRYGKNELVHIYLIDFVRVLMDTETQEKCLITLDKKLNKMIKRYRKTFDLEYEDILDPYVTTMSCFEFQEEPHMTQKFAINQSLINKLSENSDSMNISRIKNLIFSHYINDPYAILQNYNCQIAGKKKKHKKQKEVLNFKPIFAY